MMVLRNDEKLNDAVKGILEALAEQGYSNGDILYISTLIQLHSSKNMELDFSEFIDFVMESFCFANGKKMVRREVVDLDDCIIL